MPLLPFLASLSTHVELAPASCGETKLHYQATCCGKNASDPFTSRPEDIEVKLLRLVEADGAPYHSIFYKDGERDIHLTLPGKDADELIASMSLSKQFAGLLAANMEQRYADFDVSTQLVVDCLPEELREPDMVTSKPGLTLDDLMSMKAGVIADSIPALTMFPTALGLQVAALSNSSLTVNQGLNIDLFHSTTAIEYALAANHPLFDASTYSSPVPTGIELWKEALRFQTRKDSTSENSEVSWVKRPVDHSKDNYPVYSTLSMNLAGICLQRVASKKETGDASAFDTLQFEQHVRTHVLGPMGYPETRIGGTEQYPLLGYFVFGKASFYFDMMAFVQTTRDGKWKGGTQLMKQESVDAYQITDPLQTYTMLQGRVAARYYRGMAYTPPKFVRPSPAAVMWHGGTGGSLVMSYDGATYGAIVHTLTSPAMRTRNADLSQVCTMQSTSVLEALGLLQLLNTNDVLSYQVHPQTRISFANGHVGGCPFFCEPEAVINAWRMILS